jgi:hypothetical protein
MPITGLVVVDKECCELFGRASSASAPFPLDLAIDRAATSASLAASLVPTGGARSPAPTMTGDAAIR